MVYIKNTQSECVLVYPNEFWLLLVVHSPTRRRNARGLGLTIFFMPLVSHKQKFKKKPLSCLVRVIFLLMTFCVIHLCSLNSRVTVYGAAGGRSVLTTSRSHGAYMTGDLLLNKGELLYVLVGQRGEDACPNVSRLYNNSRQFRKSAIAQ